MEGDEGGYPGEDDGVDCCDDGPFPASTLVLDGYECRYTWEVKQDEDHVGQGTGWGDRVHQCLLETGLGYLV